MAAKSPSKAMPENDEDPFGNLFTANQSKVINGNVAESAAVKVQVEVADVSRTTQEVIDEIPTFFRKMPSSPTLQIGTQSMRRTQELPMQKYNSFTA